MKKSAWIMGSFLILAILLQGSRLFKPENITVKEDVFAYPASVKKVIDQKCYGCHSVKGRDQDAKDALMWDDLPGLEKAKVISTLDDIIGVLEDGSMPPEDVVKKYPEAKLLDEERSVLHAWAEATADSLVN